MAKVLTRSSSVTCGHGSGAVSTTGQAKLAVSGSGVLVKAGVKGKSVSASCSTMPASDSSGPTAKKCTQVSDVTAGESTKLFVAGKPVLLETLKGKTDGMVGKVTPQTTLTASAGQNKLTAS
jgi:hypothetical protein